MNVKRVFIWKKINVCNVIRAVLNAIKRGAKIVLAVNKSFI